MKPKDDGKPRFKGDMTTPGNCPKCGQSRLYIWTAYDNSINCGCCECGHGWVAKEPKQLAVT